MAALSSLPERSPRVLAERYELVRPLGYGGMAEVWRARDLVLRRPVAVKLLKENLAGDPVVVERFRREASAAARLAHPCIVRVFDTVSSGGQQAVVMELVEGRTLRQRLDRDGRLPVSDVVAIGIALADALDAAHRAQLVHRDVKPGNILLTDDGRVLLTDFGIATAMRSKGDLTREDVMMGTAKYLSPEQVLGVPVDGRSDLFSLGVVLYECLAGRPPFVADTDAATALARLQRTPVPLRTVRPGVPRDLEGVVHACLARRPELRPASGAALRDRLSRIDLTAQADSTPTVVDSGALRRNGPSRSARRAGAVTAAAALVLAGLAAVALAPGEDTTADPAAVVSSAVTPTDATATTVAPTAPPPPPAGAVTVSSVVEFDPPPGNGRENPGQLGGLLDADPATAWNTVCYESPTFGTKGGIGLIFTLTGPANGLALEITSPGSGWSARTFVAERSGATLAAWGTATAVGRDLPAGTVRFPLGGGTGTQVLLWLDRSGRAVSGCTFPFQVRLSNARVAPL